MLTMAVGHSDDVDPADAIADVVEQCRASLGSQTPQAGILISAFESFDPSIVAALRDAFGGVDIVGATSAAEISSAGGYREDSIALALFALDSIDVSVGLGQGLTDDTEEACRAAVAQALRGTDREPKLGIVFTGMAVVDPQRVLDAIARTLPSGVVLLGGGSGRSDLSSVGPTYQFWNDVVATDGVAIALFSGPIAFSTAVGTGWRPIGPLGVITTAGPGVIMEIDGRPAHEFLARYLDTIGPASFGNPLAIMEEGMTEPYLRVALASDATSGNVAILGSVPVGATVQLAVTDSRQILSGATGAMERAVADFPAGTKPEAALIFSCAVRRSLLGSQTRLETETARSLLGASVPVAGLYCLGELAPIGGVSNSRFLNETFVALLLGT
jgi:hypothetical protein